MKTVKLKPGESTPINFTGIVEFSNGEKRWFLNDKRHRKDGPAIVGPNGEKHWYLNGKRHREDGPAIVYSNGEKRWYLNGKEVDFQTFELFYMLKYNKIYKEFKWG